MAFTPFIRFGYRLAAMAVFLSLCQACSPLSPGDLDGRASAASMHYQEISTGSFVLATYARIRDTNQPVTIYVEGDSRGWLPSTEPGHDATPDGGLGLRLATLDPSANVVYIAQPCQFDSSLPVCAEFAKADTRYAEQIMAAMNRAIDHFVVVFPHPHINLVGYSGGGAVAAVLAARRHDVATLRTIAGNLDPEGNGRYHAADPQEDFVDPIDYASRLYALPQEHLVGDKDDVVPPFLTENFIKAIGTSYCVRVIHIPEATHKTGWEQAWKTHVTDIPACDLLSH